MAGLIRPRPYERVGFAAAVVALARSVPAGRAGTTAQTLVLSQRTRAAAAQHPDMPSERTAHGARGATSVLP